jgi:hypothetical protein
MLNDPVHYKFNASVSLSPMTGGAEFGLFADDGGSPPLSVLEFTDGELGWSWSDLAIVVGTNSKFLNLLYLFLP